MSSKQIVVSYEKASEAVRQALKREFPFGFEDAVMKIPAPKPFYAVLVEMEDATYLVKVNVRTGIDGPDVELPNEEVELVVPEDRAALLSELDEEKPAKETEEETDSYY